MILKTMGRVLMERRIVISIKLEFVREILNGTKAYEYRRRAAKGYISSLLIYETAPTKKIVAEAEVLDILSLAPSELWEKTKDHSGITKSFFDEYFANRNVAYAYKLGKIMVFKEPKELKDFGLEYAPQSFAYAVSK